MQRILNVLVFSAAAVAVLLLVIAVLLLTVPELLITSLRVAMIVACGISGLGILTPMVIILHFSIYAKRKSKESINS